MGGVGQGYLGNLFARETLPYEKSVTKHTMADCPSSSSSSSSSANSDWFADYALEGPAGRTVRYDCEEVAEVKCECGPIDASGPRNGYVSTTVS